MEAVKSMLRDPSNDLMSPRAISDKRCMKAKEWEGE